jgi:hypothetical protein
MMGNDPHPTFLEKPVAASTHLYTGALLGLNVSGNLVPAGATAKKILGRCEAEADNSAGIAGAITARVRQGVFKYANSATTDALTSADEGYACFAVDDQTVARTDSNGTRPRAGTVISVETDGVWVQVMFDTIGDQGDSTMIDLIAADNFALTPFVAITVYNDSGVGKAKTAVAGDPAVGILQNTPVAGAVAKIRVSGKSTAYASGSINPGVVVASTANGQLKAAVAFTAPSNSTSNASTPIGVALTLGSTNNAFQVLLRPTGPIPSTGV